MSSTPAGHWSPRLPAFFFTSPRELRDHDLSEFQLQLRGHRPEAPEPPLDEAADERFVALVEALRLLHVHGSEERCDCQKVKAMREEL